MSTPPPDDLRFKRAELAALQRGTRRTRTLVLVLLVVEVMCVVMLGLGWLGKG